MTTFAIKSSPTYSLNCTATPNRLGITLTFHQAFPMAQHPRWQQVMQVTLGPDGLRELSENLAELCAQAAMVIPTAELRKRRRRRTQP